MTADAAAARDPAPASDRPFLTADWRCLAMLNYEVAPDVLLPWLPKGTELDDFEGRTLASVVGFRFLDTRVLGVPVPLHREFDEVNLRFYVRREGPEGWRHGVVFVRELVPRPMITWAARLLYNEPYRTVPMRHQLSMSAARSGWPGQVRYDWRYGGRRHHLEATTTGSPATPEAGSEGEFITARHWGYTTQRDGGCKEYRVTHPRWQVWKVASASLVCDVAQLFGPRFVEALGSAPRSALVAEGSEVTVFTARRLEQGGVAA